MCGQPQKFISPIPIFYLIVSQGPRYRGGRPQWDWRWQFKRKSLFFVLLLAACSPPIFEILTKTHVGGYTSGGPAMMQVHSSQTSPIKSSFLKALILSRLAPSIFHTKHVAFAAGFCVIDNHRRGFSEGFVIFFWVPWYVSAI